MAKTALRRVVRDPGEQLPAVFDPAKTALKETLLDANIRLAIKLQDWETLETALEEKVQEEDDFVRWWDGNVGVRLHNKVSADRGTLAMSDAEALTKISNQQVSRWRKKLKDKDKYIADQMASAYRKAGLTESKESTGSLHVSQGNNDWYTPPEYIIAAREVMGDIDLDPASSDVANKTIQANHYFTREDDGLTKEWFGRVWLNPPFSMPLVKQFADKLIAEREAGRVEQATVIVNNGTDTQWFHALLGAAGILCLLRGRAKFYSPDSDIIAARQGQVIFYLGENRETFTKVFSEFGAVLHA
jgi:phage N-6-adenine-methyltransferase